MWFHNLFDDYNNVIVFKIHMLMVMVNYNLFHDLYIVDDIAYYLFSVFCDGTNVEILNYCDDSGFL